MIDEEELRQIAPASSRVMEVREFVRAAEVDPVYLDASYYVVPELGGEKPYTLLFETLRRSGYVSLAQWTAHNREHLVVLRPGRLGLVVHTLFYSDEVRAMDEFHTDTQHISAQELELAHLLVNALAAPFEPAKYRDAYRAQLQALIDAKIRGEQLKPEAAAPRLAPVTDILKALQASLACATEGTAAVEQRPQPMRRARRALAS